jgi:hypothetical protein
MKYKIQIKRLVGEEWKNVDMKELEGSSIVKWMKEAKETSVACLYQDDRPMAFLSNSLDYAEQYKAKGLSLHIDILQELLGNSPAPSLLVQIFEGSALAEISFDSTQIKR